MRHATAIAIAESDATECRDSVLECGSPLPLWIWFGRREISKAAQERRTPRRYRAISSPLSISILRGATSLLLALAAGALTAAADSAPQLISTTGGHGGDDAASVKKWPDTAALQKAAGSGDPDACHELGNRYLAGAGGLPQNPARAMLYFEDAARKGHRDAAFRLGKMYSEGAQIPRDYPKAIEYYTIAARAGHALAQHNLGAMYASGRGVKTDYAEGLAWLILATRNAPGDADTAAGEKRLREFLAGVNRSDTIAAGEKRARELTQELADAKNTAARPTPQQPGGAKLPQVKTEPIKIEPIQMTPPAFTPMQVPLPAMSGTGNQ